MATVGDGFGRRDWLKRIVATGTVGVAGCLDVGEEPTATTDADGQRDDDGDDETATPTATGSPLAGMGGRWAQFRRDGTNTGVAPAGAGPGDDLGTAWSFAVEDLVSVEDPTMIMRLVSSPVVSDGTVAANVGYGYLDDDDLTRGAALVGFDAVTGERAWTHQLSEPTAQYVTDPVLVGERVLSLDVDLEAGQTTILAVDAPTGEVVDEFRFDGLLATATMGEERLYAWGLSRLVAIDPADGSVDWSTDVEYNGQARFHLAVADGLVLATLGHEFVAFDAATGDRRWRTAHEVIGQVIVQGPTPFASPTVVDGTAYAAGSLQTLMARGEAGLIAFDPTTGTERWRFKPATEALDTPADDRAFTGSAAYGYPLIADGRAYVTGMRAVWAETDSGQFSPVTIERSLFVLDVETGTVRDERPIDRIAFVPVAAGDVLYLPGADGLGAIGVSGDRAAGVEAELPVSKSPAIGKDRLYLPTRTGLLALGR